MRAAVVAGARGWLGVLALIGLFALLAACAGCAGSPTAPDEGPAVADLVARGWDAYRAGDPAGALELFADALALAPDCTDALTGEGWCLARLGRYDDASAAFAAATASATGAAGAAPPLDAYAGRALVAGVLEQHAVALEAATVVLVRAPAYVFAHDPRVDAHALRLVRAQVFLHVGRFADAAAELDRLDPAGAPHSLDPLQLMADLAALGGVASCRR